MGSVDIYIIRVLAALVLSSAIIYLFRKYKKNHEDDNGFPNHIELKEILIPESKSYNKNE